MPPGQARRPEDRAALAGVGENTTDDRGAQEHVRSDNGLELIAAEIRRWLDRASVATLYIKKGSPWENGYVESFGRQAAG